MKRFIKVTTCLRGGNKIVTVCGNVTVYKDEATESFIEGVVWDDIQNKGNVIYCDIHEIQSVDCEYMSKLQTILIQVKNFFVRVF